MFFTSDLIGHMLAWTWGQCILWNQHTNQFSDVNGREFQQFVHRTNNICWRYTNGMQTLDGSCSDLECDLAMKARSVFGVHIPKAEAFA